MKPSPLAPFQVLTKPIGPICNLDCTYCFYLEKEGLYPNERTWAMEPAVMESFIRQYIESSDQDTVVFAWQGGEPTLLGVSYFQKIIELQQRYADGKRIENAIQTNGVLIDEQWIKLFVTHQFLVGVSIDGPAYLHDVYRKHKGGQSTHSLVTQGIERLRNAGVAFNTLTTVNRVNAEQPLEVYRFLKSIGSEFMQFIPVVERSASTPDNNGLVLIRSTQSDVSEVTPWSVTPGQYGAFLCTIFDEWVRNDVGLRYIQMFEVALQMWVGMPSSLCVFGETCGSALALEHQGDLYSCDHFVYPEHKLGNILEKSLDSLARNPQQQAFGLAKKKQLPPECIACEVLAACNGECPKNRFALASDGTRRLNYLCSSYKQFFLHADPFLQWMANALAGRQSPAGIMQCADQLAQQAQMAVGPF